MYCGDGCATDRKQFHIIIHSRTFAFMATVADGAVRFSIGLPYGVFDFYMRFQKSDANGHLKVESVANIAIVA